MIDEKDLVKLVELALNLPAGWHGFVLVGEKIKKAYEVLVMLIFLVVDTRIGTYSL